MYYVYIVECSDGTLYTGYTNDVDRRISVHNSGRGAKYTRGRRPVKLRYCEEFERKEEALCREIAIKRLNKLKKLKLINDWNSKNIV